MPPLSNASEASFPGARDFREFRGAMAEVNASFDPVGGAFKKADAALATDRMRNQRDLLNLQHQIDILKLQRQIEELKKPGSEIGDLPTVERNNSGDPASTAPSDTRKGIADVFKD